MALSGKTGMGRRDGWTRRAAEPPAGPALPAARLRGETAGLTLLHMGGLLTNHHTAPGVGSKQTNTRHAHIPLLLLCLKTVCPGMPDCMAREQSEGTRPVRAPGGTSCSHNDFSLAFFCFLIHSHTQCLPEASAAFHSLKLLYSKLPLRDALRII